MEWSFGDRTNISIVEVNIKYDFSCKVQGLLQTFNFFSTLPSVHYLESVLIVNLRSHVYISKEQLSA